MIDFSKSVLFKLMPDKKNASFPLISPLLINGENVVESFTTVRDCVVFTDKRIIAVNVQGITGSKKDFTSIPYSKIQTFSVETAGTLDNDAEMDIWISGLGKIRFEFTRGYNVVNLAKLISEKIL